MAQAQHIRGRKPTAWNAAKDILEAEGLGYDGPKFKSAWSVYKQAAKSKDKPILPMPELSSTKKNKTPVEKVNTAREAV